ncbi:hypothetical protein [Streptomyces iconiensis]|uniref:DUF2690 domain-containing protein n=1 Tax=Streptomyces iconiensis TaxID=1384038 RepID=A0ABT6ZSP3_9ACTN|nr:hypothetical protein [Streptomyces iconiensis]MDJ1132079.1 hypothetical protein [Streptomyces iconiensis]
MQSAMTKQLSKGLLAAAATSALILLPAGAAFAGSGPSAPAPDKTKRSVAPSPAGNPVSKKAVAAGVCDDAVEIGQKGLIKRDGTTLASVKQFYSKKCNENYGYLWVWESFHQNAKPYDVTLGVYNYTSDTTYGANAWKGTQQEFWTKGTATVKDCTSAVGTLRPAGAPQPYQAVSQKRC